MSALSREATYAMKRACPRNEARSLFNSAEAVLFFMKTVHLQ